MMIMRPPQHGQGGRGSVGSTGSAGSTAGGIASSSSGAGDIGLAAGAREQAIVPNAVKTLRQHVEQEAADELVRGQASSCDGARHRRGDNPCSGR